MTVFGTIVVTGAALERPPVGPTPLQKASTMTDATLCAVCGAAFRPRGAGQLTCSKSCGAKKSHQDKPRSVEAMQAAARSPEARAKKSATLSGEGNPMHGRTGAANPAFTTGEYAGVKFYRRQRGHACADCGTGDDLLVHHEDRDRQNNDLSNLVTLCRGCHTKRHLAAGDIPEPPYDPSRERDAAGWFV